MEPFKYKDFSSDVNVSWEQLSITATNPPSGNTDKENAQLRTMIHDLTQAVLDHGPNKTQHMKILVRHRTEWPHLWDQIDKMISFTVEDQTSY